MLQRLKRLKRPGRKAMTVLAAVAVVVAGCAAFTGCHGGEATDSEKLQDLEFSVVAEQETPVQLQDLIRQKRENPFKLTYADGQDMYIVVGEGPQKGGGYSVAVKELYLTENSVVIRTELTGPEKNEASGTDTSYPVLTQFYEEPVVFR